MHRLESKTFVIILKRLEVQYKKQRIEKKIVGLEPQYVMVLLIWILGIMSKTKPQSSGMQDSQVITCFSNKHLSIWLSLMKYYYRETSY